MEPFEDILSKYTRYIRKLSLSYGQSQSDIINDLYQEGVIGLYMAYQKFNEEKNIPFLGYAHFWVKKYQLDYLTKNGRTIRIPAYKINDEEIKTNTYTITTDSFLGDNLTPAIESETPDYSCLYEAINELKRDTKDMVLMYYGLSPYDSNEKWTYEKIGDKYGLTKQAISLRIQSAISKLLNNKKLNYFDKN